MASRQLTFAITLALLSLIVVFSISSSSARRADSFDHPERINGFELLPHDHPIMQEAEPGTVIDTGIYFGPYRASVVKLPNAIEERNSKLAQFQVNSPLGDVNVPSDFMTNRFPNQYAASFVHWLNTANIQTYQGQNLKIVQADILGFPPTPIPTSGHVTRDFMNELGGLNITLDSVQYGTLTPFLSPYGYNSAFFTNDANTTQTHLNSYNQQVTKTYTASFTSGLNLGFSESITVGVPSVESSTTQYSMQWSFSSTKTSSSSSQQTITDSTTVQIPPHSLVNVTCYVEMGHLNTNFKANVHLSPNSNVGWVFQDAVFYPPGQSWFWFFQTYQTINGMKEVGTNFENSLNYEYESTGVFNGVAGNTCQCSIYQCPYEPNVNKCVGKSI